MGGLTALSSILPAGQLAGKLGTLTKGAGAFLGGNKLYAAVSVVSSATDSVVNGYIMTSDFTASFDELESIKDPKQKEEAKRKLLFMALLNGALTYHALKGDIGDLKALKAQGHLIPDDILLQKKLKPRDALPSQVVEASVLNETSIARTTLSTGMTDPNSAAAKQNVLTPGKLQTVHYDPAKGHEGWKVKKQQTVTLGAKKNELGEIEYSRTDASGKKVLNKEQYEQEIRFGKEVKRQQALSLADIEGRIIDEAGNIDPEKLKEFFNELQAQGVQIMTGKNAKALLKKHNANALYLPGDTPGQPGMIVLRENADKQHIIEEIFHLKQHEQEGFRRLGASEIIDMEIDAHVQMLEYARTKGWTKEEIEQLERNKAAWESDRKMYNSDVEFRKRFDDEFDVFRNRKKKIDYDELNKNKFFAETVSGLMSGKIPRRDLNLSIEEEAIIRLYTTSEGHNSLNAALRGEVKLTSFMKSQINLLNQAINKLPTYSGSLYRGIGKKEAEKILKLKKGDVYHRKDYTSSSIDEEEALSFSLKENSGVFIYISSTNSGVNISHISEAYWEGEVLFKNDTKYTIGYIGKRPRFVESDPIIIEIELIETK